jgi:hypothetical protein
MGGLYYEVSTLLTIVAAGFLIIGLTKIAIRFQRGEAGWDNELLTWFGGALFFGAAKIAVGIAFQV